MQNSRKILAAVVGSIGAIGLALLLAVRANDLSTVPVGADAFPPVATLFAALGRVEPWAAFVALVALLCLLVYAALPNRGGERESLGLADLCDRIDAQHDATRADLGGLREELAGEIGKATAALETRIGEVLRAGISAQDNQVRKTLDHFNARAGWQIQQLSAKLDRLPQAAADDPADRATPP